MNYYLCKDVMEDVGRRAAFNELAVKTFGLSFEAWYELGFCSEKYMPYTLFHRDQAIANVSVNKMEVLYKGKILHYIQLGTVMTDTAYRRKGFSRYILEEVLGDWKTCCDSVFLFANHGVLDFYPQFGFEKEQQHQFSIIVPGGQKPWRKLDVNNVGDQELLLRCYRKRNPFSRIQVVNNYDLLMFYAISVMRNCIYYSSLYDAVVIAQQEKEALNCYDVFCDQELSMTELLTSLADAETITIQLKFTPEARGNIHRSSWKDQEDTLFVLKGKDTVFKDEKLLFPSISHT